MTSNEIIMIAGMMAVTFGIRYILLALADRFFSSGADRNGRWGMYPLPY